MVNTSRTLPCLVGAAAIALGMLAHPSAGAAVSTPVILQIVPAAPVPASWPQAIEIDGHDFQAGLSAMLWTPDGGTVEFKDKAIQGQSDAAFHITAVLDREGTYRLVVTNRDGGVSPPFAFRVAGGPQSASPVIDDVTPRDLRRDRTAQDLRVTGRGFTPGLQVRLTDPLGKDVTDVTVSRIASGSFDLRVLLASAGDYQLAVVNSSGVVSNVWRLAVQ
jgi:hypothetical protein